MSPKFLIALAAACIAFAPAAMAQFLPGQGASGSPDASRSGVNPVDDQQRMGGGAGKSKSPAKAGQTGGQTGAESERMGGGSRMPK